MNKEAWLIFRNGEHKLQRILKDGYGHVSILYKDDYNWILIAPNERSLEVIILPYATTDNAPGWLSKSKEMKLLKLTYRDMSKNTKFPRLLIGFTCVTFVKYFIGYKDFSVTPYQLYKSLLKMNKNIIKSEVLL